MTHHSQGWESAHMALSCLASAPKGLGGAVIRMRAGPARDDMLAMLRRAFPNLIRLHPSIDDIQLFGGVDIAGTLQSGKLVKTAGLLQGSKVFCLTMAERCTADLAAKLAQYLDAFPDSILFALDEGADEGEACPTVLQERLAFHLAPEGRTGFAGLSAAKHKEPRVSDDLLAILTTAAASFGIPSLRAPLQAVATARALAGMAGKPDVDEADLAQAAALVFAHRATRLPAEDSAPETPPDPPPQNAEDTADGADDAQGQTQLPSELVVEAVASQLPPEILAGLGRTSLSAGKGKGSGQKRKGNRRGRPKPSLPGRLDGRRRLDLIGTLRAAAPWQTIREKAAGNRPGLHIRPSDFRMKRFETQSDRLLIFAVDASGSAAVARLNEAKGAIELLLGEAYAARDHVALVAFRDTGAQVLLPPTRSLVQTKRRLAALPGGGGTPLAAGLQEALMLTHQARGAGMSPVIILMTDGKSNIALDGQPDRARAQDDSLRMAKAMRTAGAECLVIDMSRRPRSQLRDLAQILDGSYVPMPRADAAGVSKAVQSALPRD